LRYWLQEKGFDGVRLDVPLEFDPASNRHRISETTIDDWIKVKEEVEKKSKAKFVDSFVSLVW
jgi:glycosidase